MKQKVFTFNSVIVTMTWGIDRQEPKRCFTRYFLLVHSGIYEELENWKDLDSDTASIISANVDNFCDNEGLINWSN